MKICPLCQQQFPDTEEVCSNDGAEFIKRKVTLPWDMDAPAGEEEAKSEEGDAAWRHKQRHLHGSQPR